MEGMTWQYDYTALHRGTNISTAKLDDDKVRQIRRLATEGVFHREIAARFGVTMATVKDVIHRRSWRHVS